MHKKFFLTLIGIIILGSPTYAEQFNLTSYYPIPSGAYTSIHLTPQSAINPDTNCPIGTIYSNNNDESALYYCSNSTPLSKYLPIPGIWTLNGNNLYLTDITNPETKKIGIGTTTPAFKLTLANDGGILSHSLSTNPQKDLLTSGAGTRLIWYPKKHSFYAGYTPDDSWDNANIIEGNFILGYGNSISPSPVNSFSATGRDSAIWGGENNNINGDNSVIMGGKNNSFQTVESGSVGSYLSVLGGENNLGDLWSAVAGYNNVSGLTSFVGGGQNNNGQFQGSSIAGGYSNTTLGGAQVISGGRENTGHIGGIISQVRTVIGGGFQNSAGEANKYFHVVAGGRQNSARGGNMNAIGGGMSNTIPLGSGNYVTLAGGSNNNTRTTATTISGGYNNVISNSYSAITGGHSNTVSASYSNILGGLNNTLSGPYALIPGGANNTNAGGYTLAAGRYMNLSSTGDLTFLWGYSASAISAINTANTFLIYSGRMGIRDLAPSAALEINGNNSTDDFLNLTSTAVATSGDRLTIKNNGRIGINQTNPQYILHFGNGAYVDSAGNFMPASSREYKEDIADLSLSQALHTVQELNPVRYNYKIERDQEYIGFIAEDIPELVAEQGREGLASMDIVAVLTKVVAHQHNILRQQKNETESLILEFNEIKKANQPNQQMIK